MNPLIFYPWNWFKTLRGVQAYASTFLRLHAALRRILADPNCLEYRDAAITLTQPNQGGDHFVEATRLTDYARRRMANSVRTRVSAEA